MVVDGVVEKFDIRKDVSNMLLLMQHSTLTKLSDESEVGGSSNSNNSNKCWKKHFQIIVEVCLLASSGLKIEFKFEQMDYINASLQQTFICY